ncbi:16S rRNA (uracil(1498)-N(3))-methyltransferase [Cryobacterium melibiosiphilum]|uniref:Ribosomal RNA small subunit methyltransferase E n=1 Tax=Cryobacterium melibiosiphilum TaxID=995039 RepID=A0A3A5MMF0_9MICO|nr:16S rRNA (uracil(1498)-N(3))-methyltransferase [Cryobacterium melibiosiphilum]RJT87206.1 16S rRNA (uracil(1498)-N(3))-methyltransferase [Cryobacterium melibiosiphilum]
MAHFYLDAGLTPEGCPPGALVTLSGPDARHAVTVSRVHAGELLLLGNGSGLVLSGTVESAQGAQAPGGAVLTLRVDTATVTPAASPRIRLVQALAKGDRDEMAVQAATELGIDGIVPWLAGRSVSRWEGAKVAKGRERWTTIVREASKQSIRPWLPTVAELTSTKQLAVLAGQTRMLLLEPTATLRLTEVAASAAAENADGTVDSRDIVLVVGPEGGLSPAEISTLEAAGATAVRLGDTVLRTSTAGPAALAVLNAALHRW